MRSTIRPTNRRNRFATTRATWRWRWRAIARARWCWGRPRRRPSRLPTRARDVTGCSSSKGAFTTGRWPTSRLWICAASRGRPRRRGRAYAGPALRASDRRAQGKSGGRRPESGLHQPTRLSQLSQLPALRQRAVVFRLQREHDLPSARPLAAMPLLRQLPQRAGHLPGLPRIRSARTGIWDRTPGGGAGQNPPRCANRTDG